jgi:hypothetical protein
MDARAVAIRPVTTHNYIEADLNMKAKVLESLEPPMLRPNRRHRDFPRLLAFLEAV